MSHRTCHRSKACVNWLRERAGWILGVAAVLGACGTIRYVSGPQAVSAKPPLLPEKLPAAPRSVVPATATAPVHPKAGTPVNPSAAAPQPQSAPAKNPLVAVVNGAEVSREELGKQCLMHYGERVLEALINKQLIVEFCRMKNVSVSEQEVEAEIDRMARKFSLSKDQWLKMLEQERSIKAAQYRMDIVWPTLALRKLAAAQLTVTKQEMDQAYEMQFGPAVQARLVAVSSKQKADQLRAQAAAQPDQFGAIAKNHSEDVNSASANGLIQPIRRHVGDPNIEKAAFSLPEGGVSPVIPVGDQFVFIKCEKHLPPVQVDRAKTDGIIEEAVKDRKLRNAAGDVFKQLQAQTKVENIFNDPAKSQQMPGVAALINGRKITMRDLAEECIERYGSEVLEGTINHRLLEQALKKRQIDVSDAELHAEVARAAMSMGKTDANGQADIRGWIDQVCKEESISEEVYLHDMVWPSAALKKLAGDNVQITNEDIQKGYESNYGPRVQCRAIVCNSQRKAQEAWEMARKDRSVKNFAELAEHYSIEANSRALGGQIPPIRKHGGEKQLEDEAFKLQKGDLSSIIQVGPNFVVLLCEGYTQPTPVDRKTVEPEIYADLHEKKQRIAMAKQFDALKENATIDNYLAGTMQTPKKHQDVEASRDPRVVQPQVAPRR